MVDRVADDLRASDCDPFFDELLTGGEAWWDQILTEMEHCDAFVPVLSLEYLESRPCELESQYAGALGKPLLPIMIEDVPPDLLPAHLAEKHWIAYSPSDRSAVFALHRGLSSLPPCPPLPNPMPTRPPIPIAYLDQLKRQLESETDLTRSDQVMLLADLRDRLDTQDSVSVRFLLELFLARSDTTVRVAKEIRLLLDQPDQGTVRNGPDPPPPPPGPVPKAPTLAPGPPKEYWTVLRAAAGWFKLLFVALVLAFGVFFAVGLSVAAQVGEYSSDLGTDVTWGDAIGSFVASLVPLVVALLSLHWRVVRSRRLANS